MICNSYKDKLSAFISEEKVFFPFAQGRARFCTSLLHDIHPPGNPCLQPDTPRHRPQRVLTHPPRPPPEHLYNQEKLPLPSQTSKQVEEGAASKRPSTAVHRRGCETARGGTSWEQVWNEKKGRSQPTTADKGGARNVCVDANHARLLPPFCRLCFRGIAGSIRAHVFVKFRAES